MIKERLNDNTLDIYINRVENIGLINGKQRAFRNECLIDET